MGRSGVVSIVESQEGIGGTGGDTASSYTVNIEIIRAGSLASPGRINCIVSNTIDSRTTTHTIESTIVSIERWIDGAIGHTGLSGWIAELIKCGSPWTCKGAIIIGGISEGILAGRTESHTLSGVVISIDERSSAARFYHTELINWVSIFSAD